jgi:hypothetical protein
MMWALNGRLFPVGALSLLVRAALAPADGGQRRTSGLAVACASPSDIDWP